MSYRSEPIALAIGRMNRQYFLPAIQREFVWKPEQIVQLFDSIMRGYPISSFLFWDLKPENRDKWQVYKFLDKAQYGGTHSELASTDGVANLSLVLDGQQRLTSLMIGLCGTYTAKKKYKRRGSPDAWTRQRLHLDLLADPRLDSEETSESGVYYKFAFMEETPAPTSEHYWFRIGRILDFDKRQKFDVFLDEKDVELSKQELSRYEHKTFEHNLERLYKAVYVDEVIAYYTETDQDYDRVLDIFARANEGGTKLSKSDLLLSMVIANWEGVNARDEIFNFLDRVNTQLTRRNDFDKDFIMKSCLVLTDLPVAYKVQNFSNANLTTIRQYWPRIKRAIEQGADLANSFGIDRDNLTSANALIPVIYYLFKNPGVSLRGSTPFEARNAVWVRRWLTMALLNGVFGGTSDNMLRDVRACLQEMSGAGADFPINAINTAIRKAGRSAEFDDFAVDEILALAYGQQQTFLALSLLYDDAGWGTMQFQQDHIFARSLFKPKELSTSGRLDWVRKKDRLGNLCLLLAHENIGKQDMPADEWLKSREPGFLKRHLIPGDQALWRFDRFPDFLEAREELVRQRLKWIFRQTGPQVPPCGPPPPGRPPGTTTPTTAARPEVFAFLEEQRNKASYDEKNKALRYAVGSRIEWWVKIGKRFASVWQYRRFSGDLEFWRRRLSNPEIVSAKDNEHSLAFRLENKPDFNEFVDAFAKASTFEWQNKPRAR
jgi:uncharacterized protein with ParB-like and HNH nuclease domain